MKRTAEISLAPEGFALRFEGHSITVPRSEAGLCVIERILRARDTEGAGNIGREAQPVQHMVEHWLKADAAARKAKAAKELEELGLTIEDLGL